jgi:hypothetical protein
VSLFQSRRELRRALDQLLRIRVASAIGILDVAVDKRLRHLARLVFFIRSQGERGKEETEGGDQKTFHRTPRVLCQDGGTEQTIVGDNDLFAVTSYILDLGECRDPKLIPTLLPYLKWESRHIIGDEIHWSIGLDLFSKGPDDITLLPNFRIRDEALYAILTIQYGDPKVGLVGLGYRNLVPKRTTSTWHIESEGRWRESIIAKVLAAK